MNYFSPGSGDDYMSGNAVIIDVRTEREFVGGHIEGAIHIPYNEIVQYIETIRDWNKPVILYSTYGMRSHMAMCKLRNTGIVAKATTFEKLLNDQEKIVNN